MMRYLGYRAKIVSIGESGLLHGEVRGTRDVITFQGASLSELRDAFADSVDEYLKVCAERGRSPDQPDGGRPSHG